MVRVDCTVACRGCFFNAGDLLHFLLFVKSDFKDIGVSNASRCNNSIFTFTESLGDINRVVIMYSLEHLFYAIY